MAGRPPTLSQPAMREPRSLSLPPSISRSGGLCAHAKILHLWGHLVQGHWSPLWRSQLHVVALADGCIKNMQLLLQSYFSKVMVLRSSISLSFDLFSAYFQISSFPCI